MNFLGKRKSMSAEVVVPEGEIATVAFVEDLVQTTLSGGVQSIHLPPYFEGESFTVKDSNLNFRITQAPARPVVANFEPWKLSDGLLTTTWVSTGYDSLGNALGGPKVSQSFPDGATIVVAVNRLSSIDGFRISCFNQHTSFLQDYPRQCRVFTSVDNQASWISAGIHVVSQQEFINGVSQKYKFPGGARVVSDIAFVFTQSMGSNLRISRLEVFGPAT
jgi:hypothetical protein